MTIRGHIENGVVVLDEGVELPNGMRVLVSPAVQDAGQEGSNDAVYSVLSERYESGDSDVAARHNEHQP